MSMNPGATIRPSASMRRVAGASASRPIAAMRPLRMPESAADLGAMRLVGRPRGMELDGACDPVQIASDEKDRAAAGCREGAPPPLFGAVDRKRRKKTDGRT